MKLAAICDKDTAVGFRLAGIHELYIPEENPVKNLDEISERKDVGVVFITEKIAESISKDIKDFRLRYDTPIIVEIPDKKGHLEDHIDFISHLIKRAVGIDIGKKEK
jgi:V/A-type H+-transporting ATPase subunit F